MRRSSGNSIRSRTTDVLLTSGPRSVATTSVSPSMQRLWVYAEKGFAVPVEVPAAVHDAYDRLVDAGFTSRLVA